MTKPELPSEFDWPKRTREWWEAWRDSSLSDDFTATDWDFLLDTALVHADFWQGNTAMSGELRARVSKLGATGEDRKRLGLADVGARPKGSPLDELKERRAARRPATKSPRRTPKSAN